MYKIIINCRKVDYPNSTATYGDIVHRAGYNPYAVLTVTWLDQETDRGGSLTKGESCLVKEGMIFNVSHTGNS